MFTVLLLPVSSGLVLGQRRPWRRRSRPSKSLVPRVPGSGARRVCSASRSRLPGWDTFTVVLGGAAGALIGLLFVSVSIRIDLSAASPDFRNRGAATLSHFGAVLLLALLLAGVADGIYFVVPAVIAAITGGVASAWLFLIRLHV